MVKCFLSAIIAIHFMSSTSAQWKNNTWLQKLNFQNPYTQLSTARGNSSLIPERSYSSQIASMICNLVPSTCSVLDYFFPLGVNEARGPKDLIAIISTMLATLMGAILVKLGVLIVLSVISIAIGKLILIVLTLKSHLSGHKVHPQPIIYEKIYYPHNIHRDLHPQMGQTYTDQHSPYEQTVYQR